MATKPSSAAADATMSPARSFPVGIYASRLDGSSVRTHSVVNRPRKSPRPQNRTRLIPRGGTKLLRPKLLLKQYPMCITSPPTPRAIVHPVTTPYPPHNLPKPYPNARLSTDIVNFFQTTARLPPFPFHPKQALSV